MRRPDIVLLVLDTQRIDRLSCYGYRMQTSPRLDALAGGSTLFARAMSPAQWTVPAHASIFTGIYPPQHQLQQLRLALSPSIPTLAERLGASGYYTAALSNNPLIGVMQNGLQRGFESFRNYGGPFISPPSESKPRASIWDRYYQWSRQFAANLVLRGTNVGFLSRQVTAQFWQTPFQWFAFKGNSARTLRDAANLLLTRDGVTDGQPIFCFINLMGTHVPYHPRDQLLRAYLRTVHQSREARRYIARFNADIFAHLASVTPLDDDGKAILDAAYDAEVAAQDEEVGAFLDTLQSHRQLDRTFLIVCADHGEHLGEKLLMGHNFMAYKELVHVPLIVHDPDGDFRRGQRVDHVVSTRRIFHTLLLAGRAAVDSEKPLSLAQTGENDPDHGMAFSQAAPMATVLSLLNRRYPEIVRERQLDQTCNAVWREGYKLIQIGSGQLELYDTDTDPFERTNVSDQLPDRAAALKELLMQFLDDSKSTRDGRQGEHLLPQVQAPSSEQQDALDAHQVADPLSDTPIEEALRERLKRLGYRID